MALEGTIFSAGGGFLFGAVAGYAIRKLIKLGAIIVGLFVVALSYLSFNGWLDVKWILIEKETSSRKKPCFSIMPFISSRSMIVY